MNFIAPDKPVLPQAIVRTFPDPVLRMRAKEVEENSEELNSLAQTMVDVMVGHGGVGLAAPQLGYSQRMLVVRDTTKMDVGLGFVLCNPIITAVSDETDVQPEGCLSLPGLSLDITRHLEVKVNGNQMPSFATVEVALTGLEARVFQHELDHLDGRTILERVDRGLRRKAITDFLYHDAPPVLRIVEALHARDKAAAEERQVILDPRVLTAGP